MSFDKHNIEIYYFNKTEIMTPGDYSITNNYHVDVHIHIHIFKTPRSLKYTDLHKG